MISRPRVLVVCHSYAAADRVSVIAVVGIVNVPKHESSSAAGSHEDMFLKVCRNPWRTSTSHFAHFKLVHLA